MLKFDAVGLEASINPPPPQGQDINSRAIAQIQEERKDMIVHQGLTLDQRAVLLATAMSCDIDYFSRHSNHGGG